MEVEDLEAVGVKPLFHKNRHQNVMMLYHNSYFFAKIGTYQAININLCKNINLNDLQNNKDEFQLLCT